MSEVILVHEVDNLRYGHAAFGRHEHGSLLGNGRVHADGNMAFALVEKSLQLVFHAHAAHRDAFGAPCVAIVRRQHLGSLQHVVEIVHRFALSHKHNVSQFVAFGQCVYLVENIGHGEITLKSLLAGLAEQAVHLASHLARNTKCGAVVVGNVHRLYMFARCCGEKILYSAVLRLLAFYVWHAAYGVFGGELLAVCL